MAASFTFFTNLWYYAVTSMVIPLHSGKQTLLNYLNPISRLGIRKYSFIFPLLCTVVVCVGLELFSTKILAKPTATGMYAIFVLLGTIIYFAFHDGIKGGLTATLPTVGYYIYIIVTRKYEGRQLVVALETTLILAIVYIFLAVIIGWLKQSLDRVIEQETVARMDAENGQLRLQTILNQLPVGVLLVDSKNLKIEANTQAELILGRRIRTDLKTLRKSKNHLSLKNAKPLDPQDWPIVRALHKGETIVSEQIEYIRKEDDVVSLRINAAPIRNRNKEIIAAVSIIDDITQEKELEKRKDDFVNMASHELKTPITSLKLYVESLFSQLKKSPDERGLKTVTGLKNQVERLHELVNELLDVSQIQTGKLHLKKEVFRLDELLAELVDTMQYSRPDSQIKLIGKTPLTVFGDKFRIYQVFINLLTNALKYSPTNKKVIVRYKKAGQRAIVTVQDFGIGIDKQQRKKIFERLYQVIPTSGKSYTGLGMGLYISQQIIKKHHGSIWVRSEKNKGSTFCFTLPLKKQPLRSNV